MIPATTPPINCNITGDFAAWLSSTGGSIAISTYQAGSLVLVGANGGKISVLLRHFDKPMGLAATDGMVALASRNEVTLFANAPLLARDYLPSKPNLYDALFLPRTSYWTGDLNIHDVAWGEDGLWIVA